MPVIIWSPRKHQVSNTLTCHTKLFPDEFEAKSQSLAAVTLPGLNRLKATKRNYSKICKVNIRSLCFLDIL